MASAFVSYAHEDQEFVQALVEQLQTQGLDVRYDQVALHIGDSLIHAISQEISEGDFLIAVVSPDSVNSEWCQKELALAATQGINEHWVKLLPVRFRAVEMPPILQDTLWADADRDDVETVARRLAAAMQAHIEGRDADAGREAEETEEAGGAPAHAEAVPCGRLRLLGLSRPRGRRSVDLAGPSVCGLPTSTEAPQRALCTGRRRKTCRNSVSRMRLS